MISNARKISEVKMADEIPLLKKKINTPRLSLSIKLAPAEEWRLFLEPLCKCVAEVSKLFCCSNMPTRSEEKKVQEQP